MENNIPSIYYKYNLLQSLVDEAASHLKEAEKKLKTIGQVSTYTGPTFLMVFRRQLQAEVELKIAWTECPSELVVFLDPAKEVIHRQIQLHSAVTALTDWEQHIVQEHMALSPTKQALVSLEEAYTKARERLEALMQVKGKLTKTLFDHPITEEAEDYLLGYNLKKAKTPRPKSPCPRSQTYIDFFIDYMQQQSTCNTLAFEKKRMSQKFKAETREFLGHLAFGRNPT